MQFLLIAYDHTDPEALARRMAAREAHIAHTEKYKQQGHMRYGAAILNEKQEMIGSMMVVEFPDRTALDNWLKDEPYIIGKIWNQVAIEPCKVGPSFI